MKTQSKARMLAYVLLGMLLMAADAPDAPPPINPVLPFGPVDMPPPEFAPAAEPGAPEGPEARGYAADTVGEATFQYDPQTRKLIVVTDEATNQRITEVVKSLDRPVPQVLIKVLFLEVTHTKGIDIGAEWAYQTGGNNLRSGYLPDPDNPGFLQVDENGDAIKRPLDPAGFQDTLETAFGLAAETEGAFYRIVTRDLNATIRALGSVGKLEVLSRPSILARNNEPAIITLGQEVPFIRNSRVTQDGQIINTVEYDDIGIILEVTPYITQDGLVEMFVAPEISTLTGDTVPISETIDAPIIAKRAAETSVVVPDGMTVVIGGLMQDNETETVRKVPLLGDIPWVGQIFRHNTKAKSKTELIIFLTPHVVMRTRDLGDLTAHETGKTELAPRAFTQREIDKHVDNAEAIGLQSTTPDAPPTVLERLGANEYMELDLKRK